MKKNFERFVKIIAILVLGVFAISCGKGGKGSAEPGSIEAIKKAGKIRIGVFGDKPPFGFVDENGKNQGYDIYLAKRLAKDLLGDEKRRMGLVVQDVTLHGDGFAPADVGRIAHNEVEGGGGIGGALRFGHDVAVEESDVSTQRLGVAARHAEGRFGDVPGRERGRRQTEGEAHSDAAAAGAGIEEVARLIGSQFRGPLHQSLRFGTGDEHIGGDDKGVPVKFGAAQDILHRHAAAEGFEVGGP